ncbi:hypothetical protein BDB01DRAFT_789669 [Pilobolus umbonatus]|nr:hypothetical protein BDB01DRAFT_789669 [Pilobolus umbonatus]
MRRFASLHDSSSTKHLPVDLCLTDPSVYFIGPATRENPMSDIRTKLNGKVVFRDRKIKWNRVTLNLMGKAGINIDVPRSVLPRDNTMGDIDDSTTTRIQTSVPICDIEKELIFSGEESIDFGLHLPPHLPASCRTKHSFVEYTLVANFSAGTFFKKYRTQKTVIVNRHYLPSPSAMIPTMDFSGIQEWFEWSAELPKATAIESGEIVISFRCSVEKERVEVDRVELCIEEIENYRFCTKQGIKSLPPIITRFPSTMYHLPSFSTSSETHYVRTPMPLSKNPNIRSLHTHQFDPFLEISHRCRMTVHFNNIPNITLNPIILNFPIIITDYPSIASPHLPVRSVPFTDADIATEHLGNLFARAHGDDAVPVDLDLPEYTPRYEPQSPDSAIPVISTN